MPSAGKNELQLYTQKQGRGKIKSNLSNFNKIKSDIRTEQNIYSTSTQTRMTEVQDISLFNLLQELNKKKKSVRNVTKTNVHFQLQKTDND